MRVGFKSGRYNIADPNRCARAMPDLRSLKTAVSGAKWMALSHLLSLVVSLLVFAFVARALRPADFGAFALVMVVAGFWSIPFIAVFREPLVQRATLTDEELSTVFWTTMTLGSGVACLNHVAADTITAVLDHPEIIGLTRAISIKIVGDALDRSRPRCCSAASTSPDLASAMSSLMSVAAFLR
jgi:hypothetical protein